MIDVNSFFMAFLIFYLIIFFSLMLHALKDKPEDISIFTDSPVENFETVHTNKQPL